MLGATFMANSFSMDICRYRDLVRLMRIFMLAPIDIHANERRVL